MKVIKIIIKVSYGNTSKIISLNFEATYEDLLTAALKEFCIPDSERCGEKFTDIDGALYTKDSLEYIMNRSATEDTIPHIVLTGGDTVIPRSNSSLSSCSINQSSNDLQCKMTALFGSKVDDVVSVFNGLKHKLEEIETKLDKSEMESSNHKNEATDQLDEDLRKRCEPAADLEALRTILIERESTVSQREAKVEEYGNCLRNREDDLDKLETRLNDTEIALNKLMDNRLAHYPAQMKKLEELNDELEKSRKKLQRQETKSNRWESELNEREIKVRDQHMTLKKLEEVLDQLSAELNRKREELNGQESFLKKEGAKLNEEKSRVRYYRSVARSKRRQNKIQLEAQFNDSETKLKEELTKLKDQELRLNEKEVELYEKESELKEYEFMLGQQNSDDEIIIFLP